jgi:hypothetical protein
MKNFIAILAVLILVSSCQKSSDLVKDEEILLEKLKNINALNDADLFYGFSQECLTVNPYEIVSDKVTESFKEFQKTLTSGSIKSEDLKSTLIKLFLSKLPPELTELSQEGFTNSEGAIYSLISESLAIDNFDTFLTKTLWFEDIIYKSSALSDLSKNRILVYCAALRSTATFIHETSKLSKPEETWEECFIRKQQDMGFFEGLACVASWPICLGAMAADCIIETQF